MPPCLLKSETILTRRKFQSLLEKMIYLHKCIKPTRIFINRILALSRENPNSRNIKLTAELFMDIDWFLTFIHHFSGSVKIFKTDIEKATSLHIDAYLTGVGVSGMTGSMLPLSRPSSTFSPILHTLKWSISS